MHHLGHARSRGIEPLKNQNDYTRLTAVGQFHRVQLRAVSYGGRPLRRTKTDFAKLSRIGLPRRAGQLAVHSEVVDTDCSLGKPFGAEVCPTECT